MRDAVAGAALTLAVLKPLPACYAVSLEEQRMFGLGAPELIVILVVALVIFGPGKLPEIGGALGKGIKDFRKALENKGGDGVAEAEKPADKPEA